MSVLCVVLHCTIAATVEVRRRSLENLSNLTELTLSTVIALKYAWPLQGDCARLLIPRLGR
jgi:hypothetical protein